MRNEFVAKNIAHFRKQAKLTQAELAGKAALSVNMIACIEAGIRQPSLDSLERIARALSISASRLLETA